MPDPINLRLARKARARAEAERQAAESRIKFGRSRAEKLALKAEALRAERALAAGRIEPASTDAHADDAGPPVAPKP